MPGYGVIVYGEANSTLRSIVMLDTPEAPIALMPGEAALYLGPLAHAPSIDEAKTHIFAETNVHPPSGRCCIVANGIVTSIASLDPEIDSVASGTLVFSDDAIVGDLYADGQFQRRFASVQVSTGRVTAIVYANPNAAHSPHLIASLTLNVGDIVPPPRQGPPPTVAPPS